MARFSRATLLKIAVFLVIGIALIIKLFQTPTVTSLDGPGIDLANGIKTSASFDSKTLEATPIFDTSTLSNKAGYTTSSFGVSSPALAPPAKSDYDAYANIRSQAQSPGGWIRASVGAVEWEMEPFGSYRQDRHTIGSGSSDKIMSMIMKEDGTRSDIRVVGLCSRTFVKYRHHYRCDWVCAASFDDPNTDCLKFLQAHTQFGVGGMIVEMPQGIGSSFDYGELQEMRVSRDQKLDAHLRWISNQTVYHFQIAEIITGLLDLSSPGERNFREGITTVRNTSHPRQWKRCEPTVVCDTDCTYDICASVPGYCADEDGEDGHEDDSPPDAADGTISERQALAKGPRFSSGKVMEIKHQGFYSSGKILDGAAGKKVLNSWFDYADPTDCGNVAVKEYKAKKSGVKYASEHIVELQTIKYFLTTAENGKLPSGGTMKTAKVDEDYFWDNWRNIVLPNSLPQLDGKTVVVPNDRVFIALGSRQNRENFVILGQEINALKGRVWAGNELYAKFDSKVDLWLSKQGKASEFLAFIKSAQATFSYLEDMPPVKQRMNNIIALVRAQLALIDANTAQFDGTSPQLAEIWDEYMPDLLGVLCDESTEWVTDKIKSVRDKMKGKSQKVLPTDAAAVLKYLAIYERNLPKMTLSGRS